VTSEQEIQQTNMMDLEIADYERAVKTLHETVADRDAKLKALQEELEQQQEQRAALQKLLGMYTQRLPHPEESCVVRLTSFLSFEVTYFQQLNKI